MKKLIYGVGLNDANYKLHYKDKITGKVLKCPYYIKWKCMFDRCYDSINHLQSHPSYNGCSVSPEWFKFSEFRKWMQQCDWVGNHLDKDLIIRGNKVYSERTCCFVTRQLNMFLCARNKARGNFPIGVSYVESRNKFKDRCCNPFNKKCEHLGWFDTILGAHLAWQQRKHELANELAALQTDLRVKLALQTRYAPGTDWTKE